MIAPSDKVVLERFVTDYVGRERIEEIIGYLNLDHLGCCWMRDPDNLREVGVLCEAEVEVGMKLDRFCAHHAIAPEHAEYMSLFWCAYTLRHSAL